MTVVFVEPPSPPGLVSMRFAHGGYGEFCHTSRLKLPTLDLFHGASLALKNGIDARVVDSVLLDHSPRACVKAVLREKPSLVVMRTASGSCLHDVSVAEKLRKSFDGPIVLYGPQVSVEPETILASPGVDAIVEGEAPPLLLKLAKKRGGRGVPGVSWKRDGLVVKNRPARLIERLDSLPVPRWDLVQYKKYSFVTSQTSWGCPMGCAYCPYPVTQGTCWRVRSTGSVVAEFRLLRDRYRLPFVMLRDPFFTFSKKRTLELCAGLIEGGAPILWGCETRLDSLDERLIARMAEAGCIRVVFGVESVRPKVLRGMGRGPMTRAVIRRVVAFLKKHGMLTYAFYMIGLPGETTRSTMEMIDFALELGTHAASFSAATPFPGTGLERIAKEKGWLDASDSRHLTSCVPSMHNKSMSNGEIARLYRLAKERWRSRTGGRIVGKGG